MPVLPQPVPHGRNRTRLVRTSRCDADGLDDRLDALAEALLALEETDPGLADPDLSASLASGQVTVNMSIEAGNPSQAGVGAFAVLRAALTARMRLRAELATMGETGQEAA